MTLRTLALVVWFVASVFYVGSYIEARRGRPHLSRKANDVLAGLAVGAPAAYLAAAWIGWAS